MGKKKNKRKPFRPDRWPEPPVRARSYSPDYAPSAYRGSDKSDRDGGGRRSEGAPPPTHMAGLAGSMQRTFMGRKAEVTVVIRTANAEPWLEELLAALREQRAPFEHELMVVDANSSDRTPLILRSRGIRTFYSREDSFPLAPLLAAAEGRVLVFLAQDALPVGRDWLAGLVEPLTAEGKLAFVQGRLLADGRIPPYPRGRLAAEPALSGRARGAAVPVGTPLQAVLTATNVAFQRRFLSGESAAMEGSPAAGGLFNPSTVAVLRSEETVAALLAGRNLAAPPLLQLAHELYRLSDAGDLPPGERGEAYLQAISSRLQSVTGDCRQLWATIRRRLPRIPGR